MLSSPVLLYPLLASERKKIILGRGLKLGNQNIGKDNLIRVRKELILYRGLERHSILE